MATQEAWVQEGHFRSISTIRRAKGLAEKGIARLSLADSGRKPRCIRVMITNRSVEIYAHTRRHPKPKPEDVNVG